MACKPPWTSTADARPRSSAQPPADAAVPEGMSRPGRAVSGRRRRGCPGGHSQRNAVGHLGVKLGAAPDAPSSGQVLVRTLSDLLPSARRRAISTFICPSRESLVCPVLARDRVDEDPGGLRPQPGRPVSYGADQRRWQVATRQRASGSHRGRDPYPGKDPL